MKAKTATGLTSLTAILPLLYLRAWTLQVLWGWFMVPLGMPFIAKLHVLGLVLLFNLAKNKGYEEGSKPKDDFNMEKVTKMIGTSVMVSFMAMGVGYLCKSWM